MLGAAVGMRLLDKGVDVAAYNRTAVKTGPLAERGAEIVSDPGDLTDRCNMIITCVKDAAAVRSVTLGADGIASRGLRGDLDGTIICEMSTIDPSSSRNIAGELATHGISMLDTPVMGGPNAAIAGGLVMMVAGERARFDECRATLDLLARKIFYLGESGTAHAVKLAMNLQISMLAIALSEGITLARGMSVDPEKFLEILNSTYFKTGMSEIKAYKMIRDEFTPTFLLRNLEKDLQTINATAASSGARLPVSAFAGRLYKEAVDAGYGDLDYTGILAYLKEYPRQVPETDDVQS